MTINCLQCGKGFYTKPSRIKDGKGKYCSMKCFHPPIYRNCLTCKVQFRIKPALIKINKGIFCSKECSKPSLYKNCDYCSNEFRVKPAEDKKGKGRFCSKKCWYNSKKNKPAWNKGIKRWWDSPTQFTTQRLSGEGNYNWKNGITPIGKRIRSTLEYEQWRKSVFERDLYTCQDCGEIGDYLHADHIKSFSEYPDLRLDINNGRTLCVACHYKKTFKTDIPKTSKWGRNMKMTYGK